MRAGAALGQLPAHHALQNVGARLEAENSVGQRDGSRFLAVERGHGDFHVTHLPVGPELVLPERLPPEPHPLCRLPPTIGTCPASAPPLAASFSRRRAA